MKMKRFHENHEMHLIPIGKHNVFRARISLLIILSFPMGKLDILKSENRVLKMLVLTMNPSRFSINFIKIISFLLENTMFPERDFHFPQC